MANYNEMVGEKVATDGGEYTIVAHVHDDNCTDESINLYVGRAEDGHHDLIASDNASMWVVGDENDAENNRDQWCAIAARCDVEPVIASVREIDADLADWLDDRYQDASTALVIIEEADYRTGDTCRQTVVNCRTPDINDAISDCWDSIGVGDVIIRGIGDVDDLVASQLKRVDYGTRTIDGLTDLVAPFYVSPIVRDIADGVVSLCDTACDEWEFFAADGRRLTGDEAFASDDGGENA